MLTGAGNGSDQPRWPAIFCRVHEDQRQAGRRDLRRRHTRPTAAAIFENAAHDFPQRVITRRCDAVLGARSEGTVGGKPRSQDWRYNL